MLVITKVDVYIGPDDSFFFFFSIGPLWESGVFVGDVFWFQSNHWSIDWWMLQLVSRVNRADGSDEGRQLMSHGNVSPCCGLQFSRPVGLIYQPHHHYTADKLKWLSSNLEPAEDPALILSHGCHFISVFLCYMFLCVSLSVCVCLFLCFLCPCEPIFSASQSSQHSLWPSPISFTWFSVVFFCIFPPAFLHVIKSKIR